MWACVADFAVFAPRVAVELFALMFVFVPCSFWLSALSIEKLRVSVRGVLAPRLARVRRSTHGAMARLLAKVPRALEICRAA